MVNNTNEGMEIFDSSEGSSNHQIDFMKDMITNQETSWHEIKSSLERADLSIEQIVEMTNELKYISNVQENLEKIIDSSSQEELMFVSKKISKVTQIYINTFRKYISEYLLDNIGQEIKVVDFNEGILIAINQRPDIANRDIFMGKVTSPSRAFNLVGKKLNDFFNTKDLIAFEEKIKNPKDNLSQTKIFYTDPLILVKGYGEEFWTKDAVKADIKAITKEIEREKKESSFKNDL